MWKQEYMNSVPLEVPQLARQLQSRHCSTFCHRLLHPTTAPCRRLIVLALKLAVRSWICGLNQTAKTQQYTDPTPYVSSNWKSWPNFSLKTETPISSQDSSLSLPFSFFLHFCFLFLHFLFLFFHFTFLLSFLLSLFSDLCLSHLPLSVFYTQFVKAAPFNCNRVSLVKPQADCDQRWNVCQCCLPLRCHCASMFKRDMLVMVSCIVWTCRAWVPRCVQKLLFKLCFKRVPVFCSLALVLLCNIYIC